MKVKFASDVKKSNDFEMQNSITLPIAKRKCELKNTQIKGNLKVD